jgi:transcriptional regulator with XRE-family HTH domain
MSRILKADEFLRKRLKTLRIKAALTQEQFAAVAGFSYKYYQAIEAGRRRNLRLKTIETLARAYGLEIHQLFAPKVPIFKKSFSIFKK